MSKKTTLADVPEINNFQEESAAHLVTAKKCSLAQTGGKLINSSVFVVAVWSVAGMKTFM